MKALLPEFVMNFSWKTAPCGRRPWMRRSPFRPIPPIEEFSYLNHETISKNPIHSKILPRSQLGASNQWAINGKRSDDGRAILACDMHLNLSVPNIWYRTAFTYLKDEKEVKVYGATLPGTPCMVIGSNTHIAWGFTNAYINTTDLIEVEADPLRLNHYLTAKESLPFEIEHEWIKVKGKDPVLFVFQKTCWGPVSLDKFFGKPLAIRWIAHDPAAINMGMIKLETAGDVQSALKESGQIKIPVLNFLVADHGGHIGWSLIGAIPKRQGYDGTIPVPSTDETKKWEGILNQNAYPSFIDPIQECFWTANNRSLGGEWVNALGETGYLNGIRAFQIRENLLGMKGADEKNMLALQLSVDAPFFKRWHALMLDVLEEGRLSPKRKELKEALEVWDKNAQSDLWDIVGYGSSDKLRCTMY